MDENKLEKLCYWAPFFRNKARELGVSDNLGTAIMPYSIIEIFDGFITLYEEVRNLKYLNHQLYESNESLQQDREKAYEKIDRLLKEKAEKESGI